MTNESDQSIQQLFQLDDKKNIIYVHRQDLQPGNYPELYDNTATLITHNCIMPERNNNISCIFFIFLEHLHRMMNININA